MLYSNDIAEEAVISLPAVSNWLRREDYIVPANTDGEYFICIDR